MKKIHFSLVFAAVLAAAPAAFALADNPNVVLVGGNQAPSTFAGNCKDGSFNVQNAGGSPASVLVDIELYNSGGAKVGQQFYDNTTLRSGQTLNFGFTCPGGLPQDTYHYSVGIFLPGWAGLIHWYDSVDTFSKTPRVVTPPATLLSSDLRGSTFTAAVGNNYFGTWQGVVDLEIINSQGQKVGQKFFENQTLSSNESHNYTLTLLSNLPPGTYFISVGIFKLNWTQLDRWYDHIATFSI